MRDRVVIVSAARTPLGSFGGCFQSTPAHTLAATAIKAAVRRAQIREDSIQEVLMGCVLSAGQGQAPTRQAALAAGLPETTPCTTLNKMCGSGMKAIMLAHDGILAGSYSRAIAGGMENMSRAPYLLDKARFGYRLGHHELIDHMMRDGLEDAYDTGRPMGYFAERCVEQYHFSRETLDDWALTSLMRARTASEAGYFDAEIAPVPAQERKTTRLVTQDEGPERAQPDKIPHLPPVFIPNGTITAANASSISDGAAALILMSSSDATKQGLAPLATLVGHHTHAQAPAEFTTAPIAAIKGLLKKLNWEQDSVDLFEINEAFAAVTLAAIETLGLAKEKVNIHGGACALGHPIGASGARIVVTLVHALKQKKLKRGIAALCIGGGEATAIAIELVE